MHVANVIAVLVGNIWLDLPKDFATESMTVRFVN
jgi:hypothetical protein